MIQSITWYACISPLPIPFDLSMPAADIENKFAKCLQLCPFENVFHVGTMQIKGVFDSRVVGGEEQNSFVEDVLLAAQKRKGTMAKAQIA